MICESSSAGGDSTDTIAPSASQQKCEVHDRSSLICTLSYQKLLAHESSGELCVSSAVVFWSPPPFPLSCSRWSANPRKKCPPHTLRRSYHSLWLLSSANFPKALDICAVLRARVMMVMTVTCSVCSQTVKKSRTEQAKLSMAYWAHRTAQPEWICGIEGWIPINYQQSYLVALSHVEMKYNYSIRAQAWPRDPEYQNRLIVTQSCLDHRI